eukprot:29815_1
MAELAIENNESIDAKEDGAVGTNTTTNPNLKNPLLDGETDGLSPTDGPTPTSTHTHIPMKQPNTTDDTTKPLLAVPPIGIKTSNRKAKILAITVIVLLIIAALMVAYFLWLNPSNNNGNSEEFQVSSFAPTSDPTFAPSILTTPSPSIITTTSTTTIDPTISPTMEPSMEPTIEPTIEPSSSSDKINLLIIGLASGGGALCILLICCLCCCCGKNKESDEEQKEYNQIKGKDTDTELGTRI